MTLTPGARLGPYEILTPLGAGGMGEVWKAKDTRLDRFVAVKVLPEHLAKHPEALARFEREAKAVAALNHPNITGIFDIGRVDDTAYAVMELLEGESLRTRLDSGPLAPRKATELAIQMAQGLAAAHEKGVVHRDLKPDNLWITREGRLKILDFGLAKQLPDMKSVSDSFLPTAAISPGHHTEKGMILGTLGYMSPEQVRGESVDARSDLFSFGAVLFEMLTGKRAFARDTASDTMAAILRDDLPELECGSRPLPPGLHRLLQHCLEKRPEQRIHSAHDLAFALESLAGGESSPSIRAPFAPQHRRVTTVWAATMAVLVLGAGLGGWSLRPQAGHPPTFLPLTINSEPVFAARFARQGQSVFFSTFNLETQASHVQTVDVGNLVPREILGPDAWLLALGPKGEMAVLTSNRFDVRIDKPTGTLGRCLPGGALPRPVSQDILQADWNAEGQMALVRQTGPFKCQLEFPEGKVLAAEAQGWLGDLRFSPDGRHLAYTRHPNSEDDMGFVAVVDLATGKVRDLGPVWATLQGLAWRPDGREIWFTASPSGSNRDLHGVDLRGRERTILTSPTGVQLFDIASDGKVLLASFDVAARTLAQRSGTSGPLDLTIRTYSQIRDLSPDGRWVVVDDEDDSLGPNYPLYLRPTDGSLPTLLGQGFETHIAPDSQSLCLFKQEGETWRPFLLNRAGGETPLPLGELSFALRQYPACVWTSRGVLVVARKGKEAPRLWKLTPAGPEAMPLNGFAEDVEEIWAPRTGVQQLLTRTAAGYWALLDLDHPNLPPRALPALSSKDRVLGLIDQGRSVVVSEGRVGAFRKVDLATGRVEPFRAFDAARLPARAKWRISEDGTLLLYTTFSVHSRLFLVEGLK